MKLTLSRSLFDKGKSKNGSWSKAQFEVLDVPYPLIAGWYDKLIGREFDVPTLEKFLELKDKHLEKPEQKSYPPPVQCYVAPDNDCPPEHIIAECPFDLRRHGRLTIDDEFDFVLAGL